MHDRVWSCIVSTGQTWTVGVTGATGYAGGEVCRLLAGHPNLQLTGVHANSSAGRRLGELQPHLLPLADLVVQPSDRRRASPATTSSCWPCRTGSRPRSPPSCRRTPWSSTAAPTTGSTDPAAWDALVRRRRTPAPGRTGCRSCPGQRETAARRAARIAVPGCYPTVGHPGAGPGARRRAGRARGRRGRGLAARRGAGKSRQAAPARQPRSWARVSAYGVGGVHRHTPEIDAEPVAGRRARRSSVSFTPTLVPMSRGILATCTARLRAGTDAAAVRAAYAKAYADEPFVHLLPEGQWPTTAQVLGANTVALQVAVDPDAGRLVVVAAVDNLTKGTAGAAIQCANLALGLPETTGLPLVGSRAVSVTAPAGFPRRRRRRRAQVQRRPRRRPRRQRRPGRRRRRRLHHQPVPGRAGALEPSGARPASGLRAVVLNSGGANACTGPEGFQDTHATAEHAAGRARPRRRSTSRSLSTGLIGVRLPMDKLTAGVTAAVEGAARATAAPTPPARS